MVRVYKTRREEEQFARLQAYGTARAKDQRIFTEEDVERIVFEGRAGDYHLLNLKRHRGIGIVGVADALHALPPCCTPNPENG